MSGTIASNSALLSAADARRGEREQQQRSVAAPPAAARSGTAAAGTVSGGTHRQSARLADQQLPGFPVDADDAVAEPGPDLADGQLAVHHRTGAVHRRGGADPGQQQPDATDPARAGRRGAAGLADDRQDRAGEFQPAQSAERQRHDRFHRARRRPGGDRDVYSGSGQKLFDTVVNAAAGNNSWTWNGQTATGATLPDGTYNVAVAGAAAGGGTAALPFTVQGTVTGAQTGKRQRQPRSRRAQRRPLARSLRCEGRADQSALASASNCLQPRDQRRHVAQRDHVRPVARRVIGVGVRLDEHRGDADRQRGARQHRRELALAARGAALPARLLHRMRRVEHHRIAGARHDRQRAHVGDQRVVAEAGAALGAAGCARCRCRDLRRDVAPCPTARGTGPSSR